VASNLGHFALSQVLHSWMCSKSWLDSPRVLHGTSGEPLSAAHRVKRRRIPRLQTALQFDLKYKEEAIIYNCGPLSTVKLYCMLGFKKIYSPLSTADVQS